MARTSSIQQVEIVRRLFSESLSRLSSTTWTVDVVDDGHETNPNFRFECTASSGESAQTDALMLCTFFGNRNGDVLRIVDDYASGLFSHAKNRQRLIERFPNG